MPILIEIIGEPAVGKTHLSLTFPKPYIIDTTPKQESKIIAYKVLGATAEKRYLWIKNYIELVQGLKNIINREDIATVIIDTGADLQGMAVDFELDRKKREALMPFEYGRVREMIDTDIIETVTQAGKNLIMTAQMDDEYIDGKRTGRRIPKGYRRMAFQSDIRLYMTLGAAGIEVMPGGISFAVTPQSTGKPTRKTVVIKNRFVDMTETGYKVLEGNITAQDIKQLIPKDLVNMVWVE